MTSHSRARRVGRGAALALIAVAAVPATASAHQLTGRYESPLPLAAYLGAAAVAVALSFAIVIFRSRGADAMEPAPPSEPRPVPRMLRLSLRAIGLIALAWILIQGVVAGSSSDADVGSLFLWTYGWVAIPILSAFVGPLWEWLDPFATLHDLGAAVLRRLGVGNWRTSPYPRSLERWPAIIALGVFVWLELVYTSARGGRVLAIAVLLYTLWTLAMMAQYGRDTWRRKGEAFTVWFGILNRIAPYTRGDERARTVIRRPFASGLLTSPWLLTELIIVAVATASILFDGLSQTQQWFDIFGVPSLAAETVQLLVFISAITGLVLLVARVVGVRAMAAGLVPIALGYLIAHYFTALAFDGQRIVTVASDPFNAGWNLFGTATFEPNEDYLPYGIVWAVELIAVVGGHIFGAIMGHRAAVLDSETVSAPARGRAKAGADGRGRKAPPRQTAPRSGVFADVRMRQVPLAALMVFLTVLTLWSLGQNLVQTAAEVASAVTQAARG